MPRIVFEPRPLIVRAIYLAERSVPLFEALAAQHDMTLDRYVEHWRDADIVGIEVDGTIAGGMIFSCGHMHIGVSPQFRARWFPALPALMDHGFSRHGCPLLAKVHRDHAAGREFVEQVGLKFIRLAGIYRVYQARPEWMKYRKERETWAES